MFGRPDSPALASILSLSLGVIAAVLAGLYFGNIVGSGRTAMLVACMGVAFLAVVAGMFFLSEPEPGLLYALLGMGIGMAVIVLGFLTFLLNLAQA